MYRPGLGNTNLLPVPAQITFELPALPESTQRAIAMTQLPVFQTAEQAAVRQFGVGSWWEQYQTPILAGAGVLLALTLLRRR